MMRPTIFAKKQGVHSLQTVIYVSGGPGDAKDRPDPDQ